MLILRKHIWRFLVVMRGSIAMGNYCKKVCKITFIVFATFIISGISSVYAEKQEWIDKNYNFGNIKRVLVLDPNINENLYNGINEHEIMSVFEKKIRLPETTTVLTLANIVENIKNDSELDLTILYKTNKQVAIELFDKEILKYVDVIVASRIFEYSIGSEYREGYTYNTTEYQTAYVNGSNGTTVVSVPVNKTHTISGGNVKVAYSSVRWDIMDIKSQKTIMTRLDDRARSNPTVFDNTKPRDLYGRIVVSFFDFLSNKLYKLNTSG